MDHAAEATLEGIDTQPARSGVVARSGAPTVELKQPQWGAADKPPEDSPDSRPTIEPRPLPDAQELRTATREELQQRLESLQATYDHLMTMEDAEDTDGNEEAEAVLQRLNQAAEILVTVSMSDRLTSTQAGAMDVLIAPTGPGEPGRDDGDRITNLQDFMRTQPIARKLSPDDMRKLEALMAKEREGCRAVAEMTQELVELKEGVKETERELKELIEDVDQIKETAVSKHEALSDLQLLSERLNSEVRDLTMGFEGFDSDRAKAAGFKWDPVGGHTHFLSPKGPVLLVSKAARKTGIMRWKLRVLGNASWAIGVVPERSVDQHDFLFTDATVGLNSSGTARACKLPRHSMHEMWIEVLVDLDKNIAQFGPSDLSDLPIVQNFDPSIKEGAGLRLAVATFIEVEVEMFS